MVATDDPNAAFKDVDVAVLVGAMPRREGMQRKDLLKANAKIFETQGRALDQHAKKSVKVRPCLMLLAGPSSQPFSFFPPGTDSRKPCQHQRSPVLKICSVYSQSQLLLFDEA